MANTNKYLSHLLQSTGFTPACSEEERAAASDLADIFTAHGFQPEIQEFTSNGNKKLVNAVLGIASFAGAILIGAGGAVGIAGVLLAVASAVIFMLERHGHPIFSQLGGGGLSQNVVAYHKASGPLASPRNRPVVVVAHYDSPRADLLAREPFAAYRPYIIKFMPYAMVVSAACSVIHMLPFPSAARTALWVVALVSALLPLAYAVSVIANRFFLPYTTGSVCNKSSVAAMLGVMDSVAPYQGGNEFPEDQPAGEYFAEQRRIVEEAIAAAEAEAAAAEAAALTYPHEAEGQDPVVEPNQQEADDDSSAAVEAGNEALAAVGSTTTAASDAAADVAAGAGSAVAAGEAAADAPSLSSVVPAANPSAAPVDGSTHAFEAVEASPVASADETAVFPALDTPLPTSAEDATPSVVALGAAPSGSAPAAPAAPVDSENVSAAVESPEQQDLLEVECQPEFADEAAVEPEPDKPYRINADGNVRFGEQTIRSLGMLSATCAIVYEHEDDSAEKSNHPHSGSYVKPVAAGAPAPVVPAPTPECAPERAPECAPESIEAAEPVSAVSDAAEALSSAVELPVDEQPESDQAAEISPEVPADPEPAAGQQPAPVAEHVPAETEFSPLDPSSPYAMPADQQPEPEPFNGDDGTIHEVEPVHVSFRELLSAEPIDEYEVIELPVEPVPAVSEAVQGVDTAEASEEEATLDPGSTVSVEALDQEPGAGTTQLFSVDELNEATVARTAIVAESDANDDVDSNGGAETESCVPEADTPAPASADDVDAITTGEPQAESTPMVEQTVSMPAQPQPVEPERPVETVDSLMAQIAQPAPKPAPRPMPKRAISVPSTTDAPAPHTPVTANRASLFDLPDPSATPVDPFASDEQPLSQPAPSDPNGFAVVDTPAPGAENFETITAPAPVEDQRSRRGFGKLFGRKKKRDDSMSDWLGVDDDFDAKSTGYDIGSWDNFEDDGWKGGATGIEKLSEDDLRQAVASMGDDELLGHDIWFVATGASENGNAGIQAFLDAHRDKLRGVFLINLESVGAGSLGYLTTEGEERVLRGDRRISSLVSRVSSDFHHEFTPIDMPYVTTDAHAAMSMSLRSLTIAGIDGTGFALSHTEDDQPYNVEPANVSLAADVVTEVIRRS